MNAASLWSPEQVMADAKEASAEAAFAYLLAHGDRADVGGAWVVIANARGPFVRYLKAQGIGSRHHAGGYALPILSKLSVQSRIIMEKGCDAFVAVLDAYGIDAYTYQLRRLTTVNQTLPGGFAGPDVEPRHDHGRKARSHP